MMVRWWNTTIASTQLLELLISVYLERANLPDCATIHHPCLARDLRNEELVVRDDDDGALERLDRLRQRSHGLQILQKRAG